MASRPLTKLTDKAVANFKPRPTRYQAFDEGCPGLSIRVTPTGGKSWVWQFREHVATSGGYEPGKRTRFWTLGTYPALSLRDARALTETARSLLKTRGVDPAAGKREAGTAQTFGELATDYLERRAKKYKKSWREDRRQLIADVLPAWQSRLVKTLTRRDVHALCDRIIDRGAPVAANRVLALVSAIFSYGMDKDWLDHNPAARLKKQPEQSRERVLSDHELVELWAVLESMKAMTTGAAPCIPPMVARGLQLQLRTGQRGGEIFTMAWGDVDLATGWWTIPATKAKNGTTHRVPLTAAALALLAEAKAHGPDDHGWVFAGRTGGSYHARATKAIALLRGAGLLTGDYWRHDFRRTIATGMTTAGLPSTIVNKVMNQQDGGPSVTKIYDRYSYDKEKRHALDTWGRHLDTLIGTGSPGRVVPFPQ